VFVLLLFDLKRHRSVFFKRNLYTQNKDWDSIKLLIDTVIPQQLLTATAAVERYESIDDQGVLALLRSVG